MDIDKLIEKFDDLENAKTFSGKFIKVFASPAFGAISKTEVDNLVFGLLVEVGAINPKSQAYEIARDLNVTPSKARNLLFQWQLRTLGDGDALKDDLVEALKSVRFTNEGNLLVFGIESPLLREELRSRLKRMGIYADASFSSEMVRLSVSHFAEFLDDFLDRGTKTSITKSLIKDGQKKDKSFLAVAGRILGGIAKKAAGEAGGEIAGLFGDAVRGLLSADAEGVKSSVEGTGLSFDELIDV